MVVSLIRACALIPVLAGVAVLAGWAWDFPLLRSVIPGAVQMKANTAVGLMLLGGALLASTATQAAHRRLVRVVTPALALASAAIGVATLAEYLSGWNPGIDELLFRDTAIAYNAHPGRMSPYTATAFVLNGIALASLRRRRMRFLAVACAVLATSIGALSALGYIWNAAELVTDVLLPPVAVHSAIAFILLGTGTQLGFFRLHLRAAKNRHVGLGSVESKALIGFVAALAILVVSGGLTYRTGEQFANAVQWISQTGAEQVQLAELRGSVSNAASNQRQYVLSGAFDELTEGKRYAEEALALHAAVSRLAAGDAEQRGALEQIGRRLMELESLFNRAARLQQDEGARAGMDMLGGQEGFDKMNQAIAALQDFDAGLRARLLEREAALHAIRQRTFAFLLFTILVAAGSFTILFCAIRKEAMLRDATLKELHAAKLEADSANRAKSAFLATMSHEIRTPMNAVLGMVELLGLTELNAQQRNTVQIIQESGKSLLNLIDDILDFSKIEAGRLELERAPVCLSDLAEGLCNSLAPVAARRGVDLAVFISPKVPVHVIGDDNRLRQVLYNLIGNAIKFSDGRSGKRGHVAVRVEAVREAPLQVRFRIADNGIGIAGEALDKLFTPFTQAEMSTTRRFGGTGLGLVICQRLIGLMGGRIVVDSEPGRGTTATVEVTFDVPERQPPRDWPNLAGLHCVLVDGSGLAVDDLRSYLESAGASVSVAAAMDDGKQRAASSAPFILVEHAEQCGAGEGVDAETQARNLRRLLVRRIGRFAPGQEGGADMVIDGMRCKTILSAVAALAGRMPAELLHGTPRNEAFARHPPTVEDARAAGRLILVVEDDPVNQKLVMQQLAVLGHVAEMARNGVEALAMWRTGRYGLILTDLHMPEMDGITLVQHIRREEAGRSRIPILALSANALRSEARRARDAGFDQYLVKPIQLRLLGTALEGWLPHKDPHLASKAPTLPAGAESRNAMLDVGRLMETLGDDPAVMRELLGDYLAITILQETELQAAFASGDGPVIAAIAHKLKSSSRSVGAMELGELCERLESAARQNDHAVIAELMARLDDAAARARQDITRLLRTGLTEKVEENS